MTGRRHLSFCWIVRLRAVGGARSPGLVCRLRLHGGRRTDLALVLSGLLRSEPSARRFKAACRAAWRPASADLADEAGVLRKGFALLGREPRPLAWQRPDLEAPGLSAVRVDRTRGDDGQAPIRLRGRNRR